MKNTKLLAVLLLLAILITAILTGGVDIPQEIKVTADGNPVAFDQKPQTINGNVMIPIKEVAEAMGWVVRQKGPMVIEVAKAVLYTDGIRNYLFSCHTITLNLDYQWLNRSIMVGIGRFFDTEDDKKIPFTVTPVIVNGSTLVHRNDISKILYAETEWDAAVQILSIKSGVIPYYDGQGLENREALFEQMRTFNKITGTLTRVVEQPAPQSQITSTPAANTAKNLPFEPTGILTEAPKVGSRPANILLPDKTDVHSADSYYEPYKLRVGYGCNWYAYGRFYEVYGYQIPVPYTGGATFIAEVEKADSPIIKAERDFNKIGAGSIAVYWRQGKGGHVVFVEYVERDENETPTHVYYTECMNSNGSGTYKPASDGKIKKVTFERFMRSNSGTKDLMGYIIPYN